MDRLKVFVRLLAVVAVALLPAACERGADLTGVAEAPQADIDLSQVGFRVARATEQEPYVATGTFGLWGGMLIVGAHALVVPPGAVTGPTQFTMRIVPGPAIHVDLTATSVGSSVVNNVGANGFLRPLWLRMSYRDVDPSQDRTRLMVAWLTEDGRIVPMPSFMDSSSASIFGFIPHFSQFIMASN